MSAFADDLLRAASRLLSRKTGRRGPLKSAYVRRSLSTSYYAIFHFCLDETALRLVGASNNLLQRRRVFIRTLSHFGLTTSFSKSKGAAIERSVEELFRLPGTAAGPTATPAFVIAYLDAKAKREDADYNLNASLSETDARQLRRRVKRAIRGWEAANTQGDRDTKHAVAILVSLKGRLRDQ